MAAESGVVGLSVANLEGSIQGELGRFNASVDYNSEMAGQNAQNAVEMARLGYSADVTRIPIPVRPANTSGLQIAGSVLTGVTGFAKALSS